jgi:hypothetical protein
VREVLQHGRLLISRVGGYRVGNHRRPVATLEAFACRLLHADLRDGAGDEYGFDVARLQKIIEVGVVERAVAELVDDWICRVGVDLVDDVRTVSLLTDVLIEAHEALPATAHRRRDLRRPLPHRRPLRTRQELGVNDGDAALAAGGDQRLVRRDGGPRLRNLEGRAHADEVVLHVHDHEGGATEPIDLHREPPARSRRRAFPSSPAAGDAQ